MASLLRRAGESHRDLYVDNTEFVYTDELLATTAVVDESVSTLSSHFIRRFPPYLAGRRVLYFTILRNPIEQFLSYLTYIKSRYKTLTDQKLKDRLPRDPESLSLRDFARWLITNDEDEINFHENYTVNFLTRQTYLNLRPLDCLGRAPYRATRLTLAKHILDQFIFVGLTERLTESLERLRGISKSIGIEIPSGMPGRENVSRQLRDDLSWVTPNDEVGAMLFQSVREDQELYDWAAARFENRYWSKRHELFDYSR